MKRPLAERLALIDELLSSIPEAEVEEAQNRLRELRASPSVGLLAVNSKPDSSSLTKNHRPQVPPLDGLSPAGRLAA